MYTRPFIAGQCTAVQSSPVCYLALQVTEGDHTSTSWVSHVLRTICVVLVYEVRTH